MTPILTYIILIKAGNGCLEVIRYTGGHTATVELLNTDMVK